MNRPKKWDSMTEEEKRAWRDKKNKNSRNWQIRNPEKRKATCAAYHKRNKERIRELKSRYDFKAYKRAYYYKHKEAIRIKHKKQREKHKEKYMSYGKAHRESLSNSYIAGRLRLSTSVAMKRFPELLEAKRQQILLQRELKKLKSTATKPNPIP